MKAIILLLLVLSTALIGCTVQQTTPTSEGTTGEETQTEVTQEEALEEVDESLLSEEYEIEIGEMI